MHVQTKPGIRQAYNEVLPLIKGDILLTFSPDGNSIPELIPPLIAKMNEGYDMVIVSRYLGPAKSADDDRLTDVLALHLTSRVSFATALITLRAIARLR